MRQHLGYEQWNIPESSRLYVYGNYNTHPARGGGDSSIVRHTSVRMCDLTIVCGLGRGGPIHHNHDCGRAVAAGGDSQSCVLRKAAAEVRQTRRVITIICFVVENNHNKQGWLG